MGYIFEFLLMVSLFSVIILNYKNYWKKILEKKERQRLHLQLYYNLLIKWKEDEQSGKTIAQKLFEEDYKIVAVYGMKEIGWILCNELMNAGIEVRYAIDRNAEKLACNAFTDIPDVELNLPSDDLKKVDLIIVTALQSYTEIKKELEGKYSYKVISLEELINIL